jgi:hypothetical protein
MIAEQLHPCRIIGEELYSLLWQPSMKRLWEAALSIGSRLHSSQPDHRQVGMNKLNEGCDFFYTTGRFYGIV